MSEQIEKQSELIEKLYDKIEEKDVIIRKQQKMLFGRRNEKAAAIQMMENMEPLFTMDYPEPKPEEKSRKVKAQERRRCPNRTDDLDSRPHEKIVIEASEEEKTCSGCGGKMIQIGEEKIRTIVKILPPHIIIEDIYTESYACPTCTNDGEGVLYKTKALGAFDPQIVCRGADHRLHRQRAVCQRRAILSVGKRVKPLEPADQPKDDVELDDARVRTLFRVVVQEDERSSLERGIHPLRRDDDPGQRRRRKKGYEPIVHVGVQLGDGKRKKFFWLLKKVKFKFSENLTKCHRRID